MNLFDGLGGLGGMIENALNQQGGMQALFSQALANVGGYDGVLAKLNQAGLGEQVSSWLSSGKNLPISADQIEAALGNDHLRQLAASFGVPVDQVASLLAQHLPTAVDQASPGGAIAPIPPAPTTTA